MKSGRAALLIFLTLGVLAVPLTARAQEAGKVWRVGYLAVTSAENDKNRFAAFRQGLEELGYLDGKNIVIEQRYSAGRPESVHQLAAQLVRLKVDVLVVYGGAALDAAKKATSTIAIVMTVGAQPVEEGLVSSLARPGGQVTGLSDLHGVLVPKRLELLKEVVPAASTVAVLLNAGNPAHLRQLKDVKAAAPAFGVTVLSAPVTGPNDIDRAFIGMGNHRPGGLLVLGDYLLGTHRRQVVGLAKKYQIPAIYTVRENVDAGGLMSYGTNFPELWRRAASYVDRIFKGAKPGDLPIEQPTKFELVINLKTAKALGLTIPPSVLLRADQVIE
jgi:putative ABC transport system substrate-binding protein